MKVIFLSSDYNIVNEWKSKHKIENYVICYDMETLHKELAHLNEYVLIVDYDSTAAELNKLITSGIELKNTIVLEKSPEIATGKMLIYRNIKAYGNSKMSAIHFSQMIQTVMNAKIWTYPELTASLVKRGATTSLNEDSTELIYNRLSPKEIEVVYFLLDGYTNNALALKLEITTRTVKAHVSSIFQKLHINDRISLILLLK